MFERLIQETNNESCIAPIEAPVCYRAEFDGDVTGFVEFRLENPYASVMDVQVNITGDPSTQYDFTLNSYWLPDDVTDTYGEDNGCRRSVVGGVYDPNLACSFESENIDVCECLGRISDNSSCVHSNCKFYPDRFGCEVGDWMCQFDGIFGPTSLAGGLSVNFGTVAPFVADYCRGPNEIKVRRNVDSWASVVINGGAYCAKLVKIPGCVSDVVSDLKRNIIQGAVEGVIGKAERIIDILDL